MTNQEFAKTNQDFINACERVEIKPNATQASKWRRGFGKAKGIDKAGNRLR